MAAKNKLKAGVLAYPNDSSAARHAEWAEAVARAKATLGEQSAGVDHRSKRTVTEPAEVESETSDE